MSAAVIGVVMAQLTVNFDGHILPSEGGFRAGLLIGCGVALAAVAISLAIPATKNAGPTVEPVESAEPALSTHDAR